MNSIGTVGKIIITKEIEKQFDYYHNQIKNKEWSGILFYNHVNGNIHSLKNLEFKATNLFLMDIGSGAFTNFENDSDIIEAYDNIGDSELSSLQGFCHSHHTMNAFFSGTDLKELEDNAASYNFYVSLIVNVAKEYVCKIVFPSKTTTVSEHLITDSNGKIKKVRTKSEATVLLSGDLDIEFEVEKEDVSDWVKNRINIIEEKKKAKSFSRQTNMFSENNSWYNDSYFKPTFSKTDNDVTKKEKFLKKLFFLENQSLEDGMNFLNKSTKEEKDLFLDYLDSNIEIVFENVFGVYNYKKFQEYVVYLISKLDSPRIKDIDIVKDLIDYFELIQVQYGE